MSINNSSYTTFNEESPAAPDSAAETGTGGGDMEIWADTRANQIAALAVGTFTDNSSFGIPAGVSSATNGYSSPGSSQLSNEKPAGIFTEGSFQKANGEPMPGNAIIEVDGEKAASKSVSGTFIMSTNTVPNGVTAGPDDGLETIDFRFEPDIAALDFTQDNIGIITDVGSSQYGGVTGTVTDFNGDTVEGVSVTGSGAGTKTASDGTYSLEGPDGTAITLTSLGGHTKDVTLSGGTTTTVDWQYAGVQVSVKLPDGTVVVDGPVEVPASEEVKQQTGDDGQVQFLRVTPETETTVTVLENITREITTNAEGVNKVIQIASGVGITGRCTDAQTGDPAQGVDVKIVSSDDDETKSFVPSDGRFAVGAGFTGTIELRVADQDRRFTAFTTEFDVVSGDTESRDMALERSINTPTAV